MNKYIIKEMNETEATYIELRILMYIECEYKMKVITDVLNFLNHNSFLTNLTMLYYIDETNQIRSENITEKQGVSSLSIDMRDGKVRFKFWDGSKNYWVYHREDLYNCLVEGRAEFMILSEKYEPITNAIFNMSKKFDRDILNVTYKYYPNNDNDDDLDILYHIKFSKYIKDHQMESRMLEDINQEISLLGDKVLKNASFKIEYSFQEHHCSSCEEARRIREENEGKNKKHIK